MKKHPTNKEKKRLMALAEQLDYLFYTSNHDRGFLFNKEDKDGIMAEVRLVDEYQQLTIAIYPLFWTKNAQEQRSALLHEYCHTLSAPMNDLLTDFADDKHVTIHQRKNAWEKVTSRITQLLDAQLRDMNKYAKVAYQKYK